MEAIELIGALLGIAYLVLQYKANAWMWVFSLLMSLLYTYINFTHHLYANAVLQVVFSAMAVVGLLEWVGLRQQKNRPITSLPRSMVPTLIGITLAMTLAAIGILQWVGESDNLLFDSLTTSINLTGTWMLIRKYYQEWICWLIVDPMMCVMYALSGLWTSAALYAIFSVVVIFGYLRWKREALTALQDEQHTTTDIQ
ncbi:MAG: nicotinamide mononucleotide transporter [Bacteroidales bacterium]|nr:nicotinamide mononucleotide transporter [Bacteroidales bacterium]